MNNNTKPQVAHAEAALGAGRPYEKSNEGHNKMFDTMQELEQHRKENAPNNTEPSRGQRIDQELAEEDQEYIEKKNK